MNWLVLWINISLCIFLTNGNKLNDTVQANADYIKLLPGLRFNPTFKQYSGYLRGQTDNIQLHYWFVESQNDPDSDPLVLWLNGGPGCSSMEGFLSENGPFTVKPGKVLVKNPYSWNLKANIIFLESPAGVGFSYAKNGNTTTDDDFTAANNLAALKEFMLRFPRYNNRAFYLTGESYAGVYIPTLARLVKQDGSFNLKAIAVGNGLSSYKLNDNSLIYFAYNHGLISVNFWEKMKQVCCAGQPSDKCMFTDNIGRDCQLMVSVINSRINSGLNIYNLYSPCQGGASVDRFSGDVLLNPGILGVQSPKTNFTLVNIDGQQVIMQPHHLKEYRRSDMGHHFRDNKYVQFQRNLLKQSRKEKKVRLAPPCTDDTIIDNYLNDKAVQSAIHVQLPKGALWDVCSDEVNTNYVRTYTDMTNVYKFLLQNNVRILVYNGDVDMACNFLGDEWFVDQLNLKLTNEYRAWYFIDTHQWKQVGGWVKRFAGPIPDVSLTFATIRGSGHMVPQDKPIPALHMFTAFLTNTDI